MRVRIDLGKDPKGQYGEYFIQIFRDVTSDAERLEYSSSTEALIDAYWVAYTFFRDQNPEEVSLFNEKGEEIICLKSKDEAAMWFRRAVETFKEKHGHRRVY
jgi:hypothetical protein